MREINKKGYDVFKMQRKNTLVKFIRLWYQELLDKKREEGNLMKAYKLREQ